MVGVYGVVGVLGVGFGIKGVGFRLLGVQGVECRGLEFRDCGSRL